MSYFVLSLLACSAVMSALSVCFLLLSKALKNVWSARRRVFVWAVLFAGFLLPVKPRLTAPVYTVSTENAVLAAQHYRAAPIPFDPFMLAFCVWLGGAVGTVLFYSVKQARFQRYARRFAYPCGESCRALADLTAAVLNVKAPAVLYLPGLATPILTGLMRPTVLLPERSYDAEELRLILKHELIHFRRRDLWLRLLCLACRAVHWYNPLLFFLERSFGRDCELACDEAVTRGETPAARKRYCGALLAAAASYGQTDFSPAVAGTFGCTKKQLKQRLGLILSGGGRRTLGALCVLAVLAVTLSGTLFAVNAAPARRQIEETTTFRAETWYDTDPTRPTSADVWDAYAFDPAAIPETVTAQTTFPAPEVSDPYGVYETTTRAAQTTFPAPEASVPYGVYETTTRAAGNGSAVGDREASAAFPP